MLFLLRLLQAEQETVGVHEFAGCQKQVESHKALAHQTGDILSARRLFLADKHLIPQGGELGVVLLQLVGQFVLTLTDLFERAIGVGGFLNRKHRLFTEEQAGEEVHKGLLDPRLAENNEYDENEQVDASYDEEGRRRARIGGEPERSGKREVHQHGDDDQEKDDCQGGCRQQTYHLVNHVQLHILLL